MCCLHHMWQLKQRSQGDLTQLRPACHLTRAFIAGQAGGQWNTVRFPKEAAYSMWIKYKEKGSLYTAQNVGFGLLYTACDAKLFWSWAIQVKNQNDEAETSVLIEKNKKWENEKSLFLSVQNISRETSRYTMVLFNSITSDSQWKHFTRIICQPLNHQVPVKVLLVLSVEILNLWLCFYFNCFKHQIFSHVFYLCVICPKYLTAWDLFSITRESPSSELPDFVSH